MPPAFRSRLPRNIGQRAVAALLLFVGFYGCAIGGFALVVSLVNLPTEGPRTLLTALKSLPLLALGVGGFVFSRRVMNQLRTESAQLRSDAQRHAAWMRSRGLNDEHKRAVAGLAPVASSETPRTSDAPRPTASPTARKATAPHEFVEGMASGSRPRAAGRFAGVLEDTERVRCTWCGSFVSVATADAGTGEVTCPHCTTTFSMRQELQKLMGTRPAPNGLDVQATPRSALIRHTTNPGAGCSLVILAFIYVLLSLPHALNHRDWDLTIKGIVALVAVTLVTRMWAARTTEYTITDTHLHVRIHGVLGRELGSWTKDEVDQVFVRTRERVYKTVEHRMGTRRTVREVKHTWDVILRQTDDREVRLAKDLMFCDWALYIEQEIENRLGVIDRRMGKGTVSR